MLFLAACVPVSSSCDSDDAPKRTLRVFMADTLSRPFRTLGEAFEAEHPDVKLVQIPSGSVLAARKLTDGNDQADVLAVADYLVIDTLLRPRHADWYICFATNEIGIAYTHASQGAAELTADNWFKVLTREGVSVGAASPVHDPCGYWTELCWRLADRHYALDPQEGSISGRLTAKCGPPGTRRSDAQQLLQLVESAGGIDYAFVYRSQALQHNLAFLRLPPEINLGDARHQDFYRQVEIELPAARAGKMLKKRGEAIVFAVTVLREAKEPALAAEYVRFMISPRGRELLNAEFITPVDQPWTYDLEAVPGPLRENLTARQRLRDVTTRPGDSHATRNSEP